MRKEYILFRAARVFIHLLFFSSLSFKLGGFRLSDSFIWVEFVFVRDTMTQKQSGRKKYGR